MAWCTQLLEAFWQTARQMSFWLLWGFLFAGLLSLYFTPARVERWLGRRAGWRAVLWAVALGVPLPLCSCGVLPVAVGLRKSGASKGATAGFLLATPQTGLDSIFATYALLGWCFALIRPLVALCSGLIGGSLIAWLEPEPQSTVAAERASTSASPAQQGPERFLLAFPRALRYAYDLLGNVARELLIGLILSALILAWVPPEGLVGAWLSNDWVAFPAMLLIGLPLYVCSTASIPMALALMAKGLSPGAALVFLIVGPALNGASLTTLLTLLGRRALACFLGVLALAAIAAGLLLNALGSAAGSVHASACCAGEGLGNAGSAALLLALIAWHLFVKPRLRKAAPPPQTANTRRLTVKGMHCDCCRKSVAERLRRYPGVTAVTPLPPDGFLVSGGPLPESLAEDLAALGFTLAP